MQAELAALEDKLSIEKEQLWLMQHGTAELEANTEELQQQVDWLQDQAAEVEVSVCCWRGGGVHMHMMLGASTSRLQFWCSIGDAHAYQARVCV